MQLLHMPVYSQPAENWHVPNLFPQASYAVSLPVKMTLGTPLMVQWLGLGAFTAKGPGSIPGQGTKISHGHSRKEEGEDDVSIIPIPG